MRALRVHVVGNFNSFRPPGSMKYQETLEFPPRTTLIGLAGAALGLASNDLAPLYGALRVAVVRRSLDGRARDLWSIVKLKKTAPERAVIVRELLARPVYDVFYMGESPSLDDLADAFRDPAFPCTLGRSDELVLIMSAEVVDVQPVGSGTTFRETVLPFDYHEAGCSVESVELQSGVRLRPPRVLRLPESFVFSERGRRVGRFRSETHVFNVGVIAPGAGGVTDGLSVFVPA